jgi:integrase
MKNRPTEFSRFRATVAEALEEFNSPYMQEVWSRALARREADPGGAVTSARTLLESVCKHVLDEAGVPFRDGLPLPELYKLAALELNLAPSDKLGEIFNEMFEACAQLINNIGKLRNELSDSHGRGTFGMLPDWRHAELAVNLSGAVATYLAAVWKSREKTLGQVLDEYADKRESEDRLDHGTRYAVERLKEGLANLVASKVRASDLVAHFQERAAAKQLKPATINKEFAILRAAFDGSPPQAVTDAGEILRRQQLMSHKHVSKGRRIAHVESDAIVRFLREEAKVVRDRKLLGLGAVVPDVTEFALWSGRLPVDICRLRWADVDFANQTCKLPGQAEPFPVLERAWKIISERKENSADARLIFPFDEADVVSRFRTSMLRMKSLGMFEIMPRFHDFRLEAVYRLLEKGHTAPVVARATGQAAERIMEIANEVQRAKTQPAEAA